MKIYEVKSASKDYPKDDIKKGDQYFYCRPKCLRKTADQRKKCKDKKALQTWITNYAENHMGEFSTNMKNWRYRFENLETEEERDELVEEVREFINQKDDNRNNIPEQLQEGHIINDQIDELNELLDEVNVWEPEED